MIPFLGILAVTFVTFSSLWLMNRIKGNEDTADVMCFIVDLTVFALFVFIAVKVAN